MHLNAFYKLDALSAYFVFFVFMCFSIETDNTESNKSNARINHLNFKLPQFLFKIHMKILRKIQWRMEAMIVKIKNFDNFKQDVLRNKYVTLSL
jgi:hypothetical protein